MEYVITFTVAFILSILMTPKFIVRLRKHGFVVRDYYKVGEVWIPTMGGIIVIISTIISVIICLLLFRILNLFAISSMPTTLTPIEFAYLQVIIIYGFYGLIDDELSIGRAMKIIIPLIFAYPLVSIISAPESVHIPLLGDVSMRTVVFGMSLYRIYKYVIIPVYIMVVANLVNMHSGFNGMQCGLSIIVLLTLIIKTIIDSSMSNILPAVSVLGALVGFFYYNKYPSRIFEGNIGSFAIGATIGALIIIKKYLISGFIILLPHTVNFLMYVYWRVKCWSLKRAGREIGPYHSSIKFGSVKDDGTLLVRNRLTLKWVLPYHYPMKEWQAVISMYALTAVFCIIGLFIPY